MGEPRDDHSAVDADRTEELQETVVRALTNGEPIEIRGSGSKRFYGRTPRGRPLEVTGHRGVAYYEPSELVVTARAGTRLKDLEALLAGEGQMLPFEPPHFGDRATLGGTIACNLSGPRRPYAGAARDFVLGVRLINGRGEIVNFGGQVMKNVAGYDVSRLMAGAMGILGLLVEVSLKVLPVPETDLTVVMATSQGEAIEAMNRYAARPLPLSAAAWMDGRTYLRLSGSEAGVGAAARELGGDRMGTDEAAAFWESLREHRLDFFDESDVLWRVSLPPATPALSWPGAWLIDWGGGQRWLRSGMTRDELVRQAASMGGHVTAFRGGPRDQEVFHPLDDAATRLHRRIKAAMDPRGLFNPGRMYGML
jgi:glycolate oxidase FAD binding subunit